MFNHKLPTDFPMQTLRKKTSPCKYKNEPGRFLGEGVSFRAKLIGVLEVPEARGDRMCQEALADLKMAIRAAGEHKQRIQVHVAIDGLRLRDDKTGDSLYHHPVHKISFIAQDMTDSRAFGYIFGSPDTGHRFFGIKTDKAASQVVIAMRDLFQVVFELKKKEIELAKQQLEVKSVSLVRHTASISTDTKSKNLTSVSESSTSTSKPVEGTGEGGVAELVDLEQELSSLRRGLTQVEGLTPSADPFGDSFIAPPTAQKGLLPPPPSGSSSRGRNTPASTVTSSSKTVFSPNKMADYKTSNQSPNLSFDLSSVAADFEPVVPQPGTLVDNPDPSELKNPPKKVLKDLVGGSGALLSEVGPVFGAATSLTARCRQAGGSARLLRPDPRADDPFADPPPPARYTMSSSPPPLPPKKAGSPGAPPPRPPHDTPPLPPPSRRTHHKSRRAQQCTSSEDEYLSPAPPPLPTARRFDITLSQLLTCSMDELAYRLHLPVETLSSMTLPELTKELRSYLSADVDRAHINVDPSAPPISPPISTEKKEKEHSRTSSVRSTRLSIDEREDQFEDDFAPTFDANGSFVANFEDFDMKANPSFDRYAVFREIQEQEFKTIPIVDVCDEKQNGVDTKHDSDKEEMTSLTEIVRPLHDMDAPIKETSRSPLKTLDELTLDSFNMFRNSVSPKPSQIDSKIEDIKNVMKNLQIEQSRRSVSPRDNNNESKQDDNSDRYAALREITITEPTDEFESLPSEPPKERKRSDEKSDGFDNSDFFDCIDNSSLSFSHVDDAFRKSPVVPKERVEEKEKEDKSELVPQKEPARELIPPRLSTGSMSDVASASSPDTKAPLAGGRWSVLAARASPWSSDSEPRRWPRRTERQTSSSSRDVSPWEEEPPPRHHRPPERRRESRHNSSGSRECLDSGSGRDKDKMRDKRERERELSRDGRESSSARDRDRRDSSSARERDRRDSSGKEHRDHRRDRRSRDRCKDWEYSYGYRPPARDRRPREHPDRHRRLSWDDDDDYSDGCGSGRSSPRERWPDSRWRRDERNYGSLGWRESRRRTDSRPPDDFERRSYSSTVSRGSRRVVSGGSGGGSVGGSGGRSPDRRRRRRHEHDERGKRTNYSNLEQNTPSRFVFDPEESTASPLSAGSGRGGGSGGREGDNGGRFRFDSTSLSPRSLFEDDFAPRAPSIAEEDEPRPRPRPQDVRKSDSVNIFVRDKDPFEGDDFFACTGSDRAARRENWPKDFHAFDNV